MKRVFSGLMLVMLCIGMLTLAVNIQPVRAATITVPDDYSTIQEAVNHANPGDTVYVRAGTYSEHIDINQPLTLVGESNENTIIEAHSDEVTLADIGIWITASNTLVENFKVIPFNYIDWHDVPSLIVIDGRDTHCSNDSIKNNILVLTRFTDEEQAAINILGSENNVVVDNQIMAGSSSDAGKNGGVTLLFSSNNNIISNNTIIGGYASIFCAFSSNNVISNNYVANQTMSADPSFSDVGAMTVFYSLGNSVLSNTFFNNELAFGTVGSSSTVYHDNFVNNAENAFIYTSDVTWSNGYPSGGNYWSDYDGTDLLYGPYQNRTGSDGIGDIPYQIDSANSDHYPLMKSWMPILPGDINGDGNVDLKDLVLLACAYGSVPGDLNWDDRADLNHDNKVSLPDLVTVATHYGQHNP